MTPSDHQYQIAGAAPAQKCNNRTWQVIHQAGEVFRWLNLAANHLCANMGTPVSAAATFAMFVLGKYGSKLPAGRQSEYVANTQRYISQVLMEKTGPIKNSPHLTIETCDGNLVGTSLDGRSKMQWRLSGARIRDVSVSGVWLAIQLRTTFTDIIRRNRGDISALLDFLSA